MVLTSIEIGLAFLALLGLVVGLGRGSTARYEASSRTRSARARSAS